MNTIKSVHDCSDDDDKDRFYESDSSTIIDEFITISNLLNNCKSCSSISDLNRYLTNHSASSSNFSTLFLNIDGNRSNFDSFTVDIHRIDHNFSVIGIAETNIDPIHKDLFMLDNYVSFYQDTQAGKSKGTGVALYIHYSLVASVNQNLSHTSQNLETIVEKNVSNVFYFEPEKR